MLRSLLLVCAVVSAGLLSGPADARPRDRQQHQQQKEDTLRPDGLSDDRRERNDRRDRSADAARRAQVRNGGGRVLAVDPDGDGYRVKLLKDGEVRTHYVVVED